MNPLDLVTLTPLMERTRGNPEVAIGLIDGPVSLTEPHFTGANVREVPGTNGGSCAVATSVACRHGTLVAAMLGTQRESAAPAICPHCTILVRPIFREQGAGDLTMPSATPEELAGAIVETVDAGARVLNVSAALIRSPAAEGRELDDALDYAAARQVMVVAAAGNQASVGSTTITRHPWVIPVAACDQRGRPLDHTNLGPSIGRRGLSAPGAGVVSLGTRGELATLSGTSAAAPFVTGAIALLYSLFPRAGAHDIRRAVRPEPGTRRAIVPPLLNGWAAYQRLALQWRS
jgi:subtilisin family serine protease